MTEELLNIYQNLDPIYKDNPHGYFRVYSSCTDFYRTAYFGSVAELTRRLEALVQVGVCLHCNKRCGPLRVSLDHFSVICCSQVDKAITRNVYLYNSTYFSRQILRCFPETDLMDFINYAYLINERPSQ